jgi:hypothetical protein
MKLLTKKQSRGHKVPSVATHITRSNFDKWVMYVGNRVRTNAIAAKAVGVTIPKLTKKGFLLVTGDKPGVLLHPVTWDGKNVYRRETGEFGTLEALNGTSNKRFKAEIITDEELVERAEEYDKVAEVTRQSDGEKFVVALLNSPKSKYFAGVRVEGDNILALNMEPVEDYNRTTVQYVAKELKSSAKKFFAAMR